MDALSTYRERSVQIDTDLTLALTTATSDRDRTTIAGIMNDLALYRQWAWQALAVGRELPRLRDASQARLERAYADRRATQWWGIGLVALLGAGLLVQLVGLQVWLVKRFRRLFSAAHRDNFVPYLALSEAQAISYDAAADTSRYLLSGNEAYGQEFADKSECLVNGGPCGATGEAIDGGLISLAAGAGTTPDQAQDLLDRWLGYQADHEQVVELAGSGRTAEAIDTLTGIRRGEAAFDFYYYDTAISQLAAARKHAFDEAMRDAQGLLRGWPAMPIVAMGVVILLVPFGLWPRLAEYR